MPCLKTPQFHSSRFSYLSQRGAIPYIVLVVSLVLTAVVSLSFRSTAKAKDRLRFENAVQNTQTDIQERLRTYIALLRSGSGLFYASEQVRRDDFIAYVNQLQLGTQYPGIQGIGFSIRVPESRKDQLIAEMQQQGLPAFRVWPDFQRNEYHSIIYLEPADVRNQAAIGFDMFTESTRRAAMERARDTGEPAASGRVTLVQEIDSQKQAGFLIYVPVYQRGVPLNTLAQRRAALRGFVYSPFRADDFIRTIFDYTNQAPPVDVQIYDGSEVVPQALLHTSVTNKVSTHSSMMPQWTTTRTINVAGCTWTLKFISNASLYQNSEQRLVPFIALTGVIVSLMLFVVTRSQVQARFAAEKAASELRESEAFLRESEERFQTFMNHSPTASWITDYDGNILYLSETYYRMFDVPENLVGKMVDEVYSAEFASEFLKNIQSVIDHNIVIETIEQAPRKNGNVGEFLVYKFPLFNASGRLLVGGVAIDITDNNQVEKRLQRSEARFRMLVEQSPVSIQILSVQGETLQVNQAWEKLWGITLEDIRNYNILQDQQLVEKGIMPYIQKAFSGEATKVPAILYEVHQTLTHIVSDEAVQRWVQAYVYPVKDESNTIREVVLIHEDITSQKESEQAIFAAKKKISRILESITDAFVALDQTWCFTYINDAAEQLLQRSRQELLGKQLWNEVFPKSRNTRFYQELHRAVEEQISVTFEEFLEELNRWIEARVYPSGEGVTLYLQDITERRLAEAALRQSEERLKLALDAGHMGTWEWNLKTNNQHWDSTQHQLFGLEPTEKTLETDTFYNSLHPDDCLKVKQVLHQVLEAGSSFEIEFRIIRPDGVIRWLAGKGMLLREQNGEPIRMTGVNFDITERKQAEAEREQLLRREQEAREEAESVNRIKDEFLAVLSHELRSPLNAILGWITLLRTRQFSQEKIEHALETIERNAKNQAQLVEDLLDVSRIIRGQLRLDVRPVALKPIIHTALDIVRPAAEAKAIDLQLTVGSVEATDDIFQKTQFQVLGDANRLQQIIWNLLSNAIKFTPDGGRVEVKLESVEFSGLHTQLEELTYPLNLVSQNLQNHVQITVSDTGKGISSEFLPFVFDRFRQADSSLTRPYSGLGLGLAIVRHLVELQGGTVRALSEGDGKGSTFIVTFPLLRNTQVSNLSLHKVTFEGDLQLSCPPELNRLKILVVDDEVDARELVVNILQECGSDITAVSSAKEAIALLAQSQTTGSFDILVSDVGMPIEDGYALLRQVRTLPFYQGGHIPAIALTAYARAEDQQMAFQAGFQAHIAKPVNAAKLIGTISELTKQKDVTE